MDIRKTSTNILDFNLEDILIRSQIINKSIEDKINIDNYNLIKNKIQSIDNKDKNESEIYLKNIYEQYSKRINEYKKKLYKPTNNEFNLSINYLLDSNDSKIKYNSLCFLSTIMNENDDIFDNNIIEFCFLLEISDIMLDTFYNMPSLINNNEYENKSTLHVVFGETISQLTLSFLSSEILINSLDKIDKIYKKIENEQNADLRLSKSIELLINIYSLFDSDVCLSGFTNLLTKDFDSDEKNKILNNNIILKKSQGLLNTIILGFLLSKQELNNINYYIEISQLISQSYRIIRYNQKHFYNQVIYNVEKIINILEKNKNFNIYFKCLLNLILEKIDINV